jgi:hypothetical protein
MTRPVDVVDLRPWIKSNLEFLKALLSSIGHALKLQVGGRNLDSCRCWYREAFFILWIHVKLPIVKGYLGVHLTQRP